MTHALLWNHETNSLKVATVDWMLSRGRDAYGGDRPLGWVPLALGSEDEMRATATSCHATLVKRGAARPDRLVLLDDPKPIACAQCAPMLAEVADESGR